MENCLKNLFHMSLESDCFVSLAVAFYNHLANKHTARKDTALSKLLRLMSQLILYLLLSVAGDKGSGGGFLLYFAADRPQCCFTQPWNQQSQVNTSRSQGNTLPLTVSKLISQLRDFHHVLGTTATTAPRPAVPRSIFAC